MGMNPDSFTHKKSTQAIWCSFGMAAFLLVAACSSPPPPPEASRGNMTYAAAKSNLVAGKTTQADVLGIFGSPNMATKNSAGGEVWDYSRMSSSRYAKDSSAYATLVILGAGSNSSFANTSSSSFDLIITFDNNDVVKDYKVVTSSY
jgi:outer membrane protein assembly factor BamE (lipoprotein component of BamABCDE complex)